MSFHAYDHLLTMTDKILNEQTLICTAVQIEGSVEKGR